MRMDKDPCAACLSIHSIIYRVLHISHMRRKLGKLKLWAVNNRVSMVAWRFSRMQAVSFPLLQVRENRSVVFSYKTQII